MRLSALLEAMVERESGERLGRAHDFRGRWLGTKMEVAAIVIGRRGLLERLGIGSARGGRRRKHKTWGGEVVPWDDVVRVKPGQVIVRDEDEPG